MAMDRYDLLAASEFNHMTKKFIENLVMPMDYRNKVYEEVTSLVDFLGSKIMKMSQENREISDTIMDFYIVWLRIEDYLEDFIWFSDYNKRFFEYHSSN